MVCRPFNITDLLCHEIYSSILCTHHHKLKFDRMQKISKVFEASYDFLMDMSSQRTCYTMARNVDIGRRKSVQEELFVYFSYHLIDIKGFFCIKNYYFVVQAGLKCSKYCLKEAHHCNLLGCQHRFGGNLILLVHNPTH